MNSLKIPLRVGVVAVLAFGMVLTAQAQRGRGAAPALEGPWNIDTETGRVHVSVLARDLQSPWSLAFLPNGDMLLTERPGRLRVVRGGALDPAPIEGLPEMFTESISGLFGLALHPQFERNRAIYFAYAKPNSDDSDLLSLAVARARWDGGTSLADVADIFVAKDWYSTAMGRENNRCCGQGPTTGSFGARIDFGPDGRLYVTSGDRNWGEKAQDPQSHLGKILRLNDDGKNRGSYDAITKPRSVNSSASTGAGPQPKSRPREPGGTRSATGSASRRRNWT
jgi:glucose/arabinose dehydrogenase